MQINLKSFRIGLTLFQLSFCLASISSGTYAAGEPVMAPADAAFKNALIRSLANSQLTPKEQIQHLLNRFCYGNNLTDMKFDRLLIKKTDGTVDRSLTQQAIADFALKKIKGIGEGPPPAVKTKAEELYPILTKDKSTVLAEYRALALAYRQAFEANNPSEIERTLRAISQLISSLRQAYSAQYVIYASASTCSFRSALFDFWFNHFNVSQEKVPLEISEYINDTIRTNLSGTFEDLLVATAKSPAMLLYLDNYVSKKDRIINQQMARGLNENYARELLELHTLGVGPRTDDLNPNSPYNQSDVENTARIFTGWTIKGDDRAYFFNSNVHDSGTKTVMGQNYSPEFADPTNPLSAMTNSEGQILLHRLALHPSTHRNIAQKLVRRFVSERRRLENIRGLEDQLVRELATPDVRLENIYRSLFSSSAFWSKEAYQDKIARPLDQEIRTLRAKGVTVNNLSVDLIEEALLAARNSGHRIFQYSTPDGFPDDSGYWANAARAISTTKRGFESADHLISASFNTSKNGCGNNYKTCIENRFFTLFDFNPVTQRFGLGLEFNRAKNASDEKPDLINREDQPIRTTLGILLGAGNYLKY